MAELYRTISAISAGKIAVIVYQGRIELNIP
jgi:hypothetical protein